jgi:hypothetical protein
MSSEGFCLPKKKMDGGIFSDDESIMMKIPKMLL